MATLKSLQAGRGLAALSVVAFHARGNMISRPETAHSTLAALATHGNVGVDFFFVLSGFIILFAHQRDIGQPSQLRRYLTRRFTRIYPIYWIYTAIFAALVLGFGGITAMPHTWGDWVSTWFLFRVTSGPTPLSVAWTLFYEIAFYLTFATLIVSRRAGLLLFGLWAAIILAFHRYTPTNSVIGVWTSLICLNFFVGMGACLLHRRLSSAVSGAALIMGIVGLITAGAYVDHGLPPTGFKLLIAGSCGLAICGAAALETRRLISFAVVALLGDASYTIYLVHEHLTAALIKLAARFGFLTAVPPDALFLTVVAVSTAICVAAYWALESRLVHLFRVSLPPSPVGVSAHSGPGFSSGLSGTSWPPWRGARRWPGRPGRP